MENFRIGDFVCRLGGTRILGVIVSFEYNKAKVKTVNGGVILVNPSLIQLTTFL